MLSSEFFHQLAVETLSWNMVVVALRARNRRRCASRS
jgi:hypothetical protein